MHIEEKLAEMVGMDIDAKKKEYENVFDIKTDYNLKTVSKDELKIVLKSVLPPGGEHLYVKDVYLRPAYQFPARVNLLGDGKSCIILCPESIEKEAIALNQDLREYTDDTFAEEFAHLKAEELGWDEKIKESSENWANTYYPEIEDHIIFQRIGGNIGEFLADEIMIQYRGLQNEILEERKKNMEIELMVHGNEARHIIDAWHNFAFTTTLPLSYKKNKVGWPEDERTLINYKNAFDKIIDKRIVEEFYDLKDHISSIQIPPNNLDEFYDKTFSTYLDIKEKLGEL